MPTFTLTQTEVADRRRRLEAAATHARLARHLPPSHRVPLRTEAGWLLVRVGLRLAHIDPLRPLPGAISGA